MTQFSFGGNWTEQKLEILRLYLVKYVKIMSNQNFKYAYIDAFAGTGYRTLRQDDSAETLLLPELAEEEPKMFMDGSARIALRVDPKFDRYIFIEQHEERYAELQQLPNEFPESKARISVVRDEANAYLVDLCRKVDWKTRRALLFLDPFGMQVPWETIKAIGKTKAIDMWYLFPYSAVNRLMKRDGQMNETWKARLNDIFGDESWHDRFYEKPPQMSFIEDGDQSVKHADVTMVSRYLVQRLSTEFSGVAENPRILLNSKNSPLFLLCFAAANEKGAPIAKRIAEHILKRI